MEAARTPAELLWDERQRAAKAQARLGRRSYLKRFALLLALIAVIVTMTMLLPDLVPLRSTAI